MLMRPNRLSPLAVIASATFLLPYPPAAAAEPVTSISLSDAIQLAETHNPDFRSTGYDVIAAQGAVTQASVFLNPSVFVGTFGTPIRPATAPLPNQFGASWEIPVGGKISAATDAAKATLSAVKSTREAARRQLVLNVQTAFVTFLLDDAQLGFAKKDQEGFHKELALNELRHKDGKIAFGDVLKLRIQGVAIDDTVREDLEAMEGARADLRHVIGEEVLAPDFEVRGDLATIGTPPELALEPLLARALKNRPDYQALLEQEASAKASLLLARRTPIPDITVLADYNRPGAGDVTSGGTYDLSLTVPVPLFDQNKGNIAAAEAALEKSKLAEESLRTQIRSDLVKALQEWQAARDLRAVYDNGTLDEAKESLDITRHAYELGSGSLLDFLDAEVSYRQIESAWRASMARTALALDNILFVISEVSP